MSQQQSTPRVRSEEASRDSEEQLRVAVAVAKLGQWRLDLRTREMTCSVACKANYGRGPEDPFTYADLGLAIHPDDRIRVQAAIQQAIESRTDLDIEYRNVWPDGSLHWVLVRGRVGYEVDGTPLVMTGVTLDITDRKGIEDELQQERDRLRVTLSSIGDAVLTTDTLGRITTMNAVAESLTGWSTSEAQGQPLESVFRIVNETTRRPVENPAAKALRDGVIVGLANHTLLISRDGTERPIDDSAAPIRGLEGEILGCVLVFRDVTERRAAEKAQEERTRLAALRADVLTSMASPRSLQNGLQACCDAIVERLGAASVRIWLHDEGKGWLQLQAAASRPAAVELLPGPIRLGELPIGRLAENRRILLSADVPNDPLLVDAPETEREGMSAFAGYPLQVEDRLVGVLDLYSRHPLTRAVLGDLASLGDSIAQHIVRKRAEAALQESELRYRLVGQAANDAIWDWDLVSNHVTWNEGVQTRFGYTAQQVDPDASWWVEHIHPDDRDRIVVDIHDAIDGKRPDWKAEYRFQRADGSYAEVFDRGRIVRDAGGAVRMVGSMLDLTEKKLAEAELRAAEDRFTFVRKSTGVGFWYCDLPFDVLRWDEHVKAHFHLPTDAHVTIQTFYQRIHPDDRESTRLAIERSITQREQYDVFYRTVHPDLGAEKWIRAIGRTFYAEDGHPIRFDGVTLDVTEQKRAEAELRDLAVALSEAGHRKDEFLATLAHELRNPLAPIRNALQLFKMTEKRELREQARTLMERQLEQMVRLVDDLMDVSRITRGKLELRKELIPLAAAVNSAVETSRPLIQQMRHELTITLPQQPILLDADLTRLAQVFSNLLNNAAKYSDRGGHIRLTARQEGGEVLVSVRDSGIGIAADQLPRIFEMFTQVDRSLDRSQGGLGIGLTLVKRLVEMHGGTIEAHSDGPGQGSEFFVRLPLPIQERTVQVHPSSDESAGLQTSLRILIVDDNRDAADSLGEMLQMLGHEISIAYDGQEGVAAAERLRPDVILLDIGLPKLNGYEACRHIRKQPWGRGPVLIAVTGWGQDEDRRRSQDAGFDHHLVKPVDPNALMKRLGTLQKNVKEESR